MIKQIALSLCGLCALLVSSLDANAEIKIGIAAPLTGIYASLSEQIITGVKFAADEINAAGGIKGDTIVIETIDDKCDPKTATDVATQLADKGIIAVIGHLCDRPSIEASSVYHENKIIQLSPTSQNPAFTEKRPLSTGGAYRLAARDTQQSDILTSFMATHEESSKIALLNDGSVYGKKLAAAISEGLKEKRIIPLLATEYESGQEHYSSLSARIVDSGATLVFIGGAHIDAATLIRDIDRLSDKITFLGGDSLVHVDFPNLILDDNPNRKTIENIFTSFPIDPRSLPSAKATVERFKKSKINPLGLVLRGYSAMKILETALRTAEETTFENLNKALNQQSFQSPIGSITFNDKGDANLTDYVVHQWQKNRIVVFN